MKVKQKNNILGSFIEGDLLKGKKTGTYTDTAENRKLGRVGQKYTKDGHAYGSEKDRQAAVDAMPVTHDSTTFVSPKGNKVHVEMAHYPKNKGAVKYRMFINSMPQGSHDNEADAKAAMMKIRESYAKKDYKPEDLGPQNNEPGRPVRFKTANGLEVLNDKEKTAFLQLHLQGFLDGAIKGKDNRRAVLASLQKKGYIDEHAQVTNEGIDAMSPDAEMQRRFAHIREHGPEAED